MFAALLLPIALSLPGAAPKFELSVPSIMKSAAWVGHAPRDLVWSASGKRLSFSWAKADGSPDPSYKGYTVWSDGSHLVADVPDDFEEAAPSSVRPAVSQFVMTQEVFVKDNDLYLRDLGTKVERRVTMNSEAKESPKLALKGDAIVFTRLGNLYKALVADGSITQLTDLKPESYPVPGKTSEEVLAKEEGELFKAFPPRSGSLSRSQDTGNGGSIGQAGGQGTGRGGGFGRGRGGSSGFTLSPDTAYAYRQIVQAPPTPTATVVPSYVTRSGYTEGIQSYPKVGQLEAHSKWLIVDIKTGALIQIACPRAGRVGNLLWSPDGTHAVTVGNSDDHKDSWIFGFDPATKRVSVLWDEHDDAWVGGPGRGLLGWLPDSSRFYFESEQSGFAHLMTETPDGTTKAITEGKFEVSSVRLDVPRNRFIFVSSEGSPFTRHIDAVSVDGGPRQKLADYSADEDATFALSPDGKSIAVVRSTSNRPSELFINGVQVTTTPTAEWLAGPWIDPPIVMVPARDGIEVPAKLFKPKHWRRGGPAVIFIHGAGYLQNVYSGWSHYFREYMFHHVLMDKGYAVLDIDYRGSAGYGKAWRTAIYRHMGGKDLDDAVDGATYLVKSLGVNPKRIGIYGGSYGGFLTLMAMFTAPDTFAAGAALRPVSDWANYNHGYTSDILNLPQDDPVAYHQSSPIFFAGGLKGALLICHGMVDTNVHFQDTVRLIERLIELGKTNWSVAPYPIEDHAFARPDSWTDEYSRILDLFERNIGPGYRRR